MTTDIQTRRRSMTLRGELRCFNCARYLGEFESHPEAHGKADLHLVVPEGRELQEHPVRTERGLRCSRCGGRVVTDWVERAAA
jgi:hypothetical protein